MDRGLIPSNEYKSWVERALVPLVQGQHIEAQQIFQELVAAASGDSDTYVAWLYYGETLTRLGMYDDANDALLQSAQIASSLMQDSWLIPVHEKLGDLSALEGNTFVALHHYRVALRLVSSSLDPSTADDLRAKISAAQKTLHSTVLTPDGTILQLSQEYVSGNMSISFVHRDIFLKSYFARCLECSFCHDWCCSFGADVDILNVEKIQQRQEEIKPFIRPSAEAWFEDEYTYYEEYAGSQYTRIKTQGPRCVFISKDQRGCGLHRFAISQHMDYHEIKPLICVLFPLSFGEGILTIAPELDDNSLVCAGEGASVYRSLRNELQYYFGNELIEELDEMEKKVLEAH